MKVPLKVYDHSVLSRTAFLGAVHFLAGIGGGWDFSEGGGSTPNNMASKGRGGGARQKIWCVKQGEG